MTRSRSIVLIFAAKLLLGAQKYEATTAQIALAWLLKRASNILLIPGTWSLAHLQENMAAVQIRLTDEEFELLSKSF